MPENTKHLWDNSIFRSILWHRIVKCFYSEALKESSGRWHSPVACALWRTHCLPEPLLDCPSWPKTSFRSQDKVAGLEYGSHRPWGLFPNLGEVSVF